MTMTRETKVGLVVCLSFLCLVGVVLGTKLHGGTTDEDELALREETIDDPQPAATSEHTAPPAATVPTQTGDPHSPGVIQAGALQNAQPLPPPPAPAQNDKSEPALAKQPDLGVPSSGNTGSPVPAAQTSIAGIPGPSAAAPQSSVGSADLDSVEDLADFVIVPFVGAVKKSVLFPAGATAPLSGGSPAGESGPVPASTNPLTSGPSSPGDVPPPSAEVKEHPAPASSPVPASVPLTTGHNPPAPVEDVPMPTAVPQPSPTPSAERRDAPAKPSNADDITLLMTPPPPAAGAIPPSATLLPPMSPSGVAARADAGGAGVMPNRSGVSPPAAATAPEPPPRSQPQPVVQASATDNPRRIGAAPTASTPPITVPSPGAALSSRPAAALVPQVESYDEETYRIKAGDNFTRISVGHFNTDKYAKALERWNANHPQASENLRADPPSLEAGQVIYIPPTYMLEKRYGSFIPGYKLRSETTAVNETPRTVNAAPRAESAGNAPQGFKWFQVSPAGQTMRDIARTALDSPERWTDVSKLNPAIDPSYAIRGGLLIKVPSDARIPATNAPQTGSR